MRSFLTAVSLLGFLALPSQAQKPHHDVDPAHFPGITPSTELVWHDCYTVFKCARLKVHAKVTDPRKPKKVKGNCGQPTVDLAIVKLPYVPVSGGPPHQGAVHVSLGGWSSSSTNFLVRFGEDYAPLFAGYDLIAIDYRGWGWTTPAFRCFASEEERKQFALSEPQLLGTDDAAYTAREKRAEDFAKRCKKNGEDVGRFMGTYSNAVDHYTVMKADNRTKMGFWGISSGAHLGQTIAKVYPEVVDKFLFDSPAPSSLAYTVTTAQPSQIKDAERGLDAFFYTCLHAPANCSFAGSSTTTAELRSRYTALETKLKTKPLGGTGTDKKFDWSALHSFLTIAIHGPGWFPVLSNVLTEAETGAVGGWIGYVLTSVLHQVPAPLPLLTEDAPFEGILAGVCTDELRHIKSKDDFESYFKSMTDAAPSVASIFSEWRLVCSKWKIDPVNRLDDTSGGPVRTQGKFVVLNGVGDPASSVEGAKGVVARFSPGVLVKTLAAGHTSFAATSNCLFGVFYTFFVLGQMPAEGTTCGDLFTAPFGVQLPPSF
ncbi:Putative alpha/beta hydrolase-1, peptidase S33 tripeptidyl aminopeptidase-like protein [Colletotrichum destructivum]|uniref:Alpha/beta hydrolase-1, peptidase S33 tripeptidyl aminopeptidase-like protein n=1 Tax=Colletotrichum destructivum TaxID=34406 RepID=A0AAX4ILB8_9PEZI|nr:Putative alpha/beta hydrolase-1, peptidase S33 tripeptidyl aminopeptidase-like protein [Colletotrichum destructivum]